MSSHSRIAQNLAAEFLAGGWTEDGLIERGRLAFPHMRCLRRLARQLLANFPVPSAELSIQSLAQLILIDDGFRNAHRRIDAARRKLLRTRPAMTPRPGRPATWDVPSIVSPGALADWLGVTPSQMDGLADCLGWESRVPQGPLRNYTYRWLKSASGKARLLEMPKRRLKAIQRRLVREILEHIPPHDVAHGFRRGRSIVTYANPHVDQAIVLRFDLRDFFASVSSARVHALFRTAGYPKNVARLSAGLCTNGTPLEELSVGRFTEARPPTEPTIRRFLSRHLPQGAPTSPALANLCAHRLDCRLAGLAHAMSAVYTRYADDLAFSGDERLERSARQFQVQVCRIALEEGFEINTYKTRFMRRGVRQQLAGIVVNRQTNITRNEFDRLKAMVNNCMHKGPSTQNTNGHADFRAYLLGRISYVAMIHPERGEKLKAAFDRVVW